MVECVFNALARDRTNEQVGPRRRRPCSIGMGDPSRPFRSSAQLVKAVLSTLAMISSLEIVKTEVLKNNYVSSIVLTMRMVRGTRIPVLTPVILFRRDREPRPRAELRYSKPAKNSFRDSTTATVTAPRALLLAQLAKHGNAASPTLRGRRASLSALSSITTSPSKPTR